MLSFFLNQRRRCGEGGFTLIELVVVLAILGILLALAVPRYLGARKRAYKTEVDNILQETKTLSWAYYHEHGVFPTTIGNITLQMPVGTAWNTPAPTGGGATAFITWTSSGVGAPFPVVAGDLCSVTLSEDGNSEQGCTF